MNTDFPRKITLLRKEKGLSQKHAAADLHISQALLSHYEKGIRECGLEFLVKIADYYNVSCDYLLGRSPEPNGRQISINDIPEHDLTIKENVNSLGVIPNLNKRLISNSLNIVYDLLQKSKNRALMKECSSILMLSVYRVFRILFFANPKNDKNFFTVPQVMASNSAKAAEACAEARAMAVVSGIELTGSDVNLDRESLFINNTTLANEYEPYAPSLLSLVQNSEAHIQLINKAES